MSIKLVDTLESMGNFPVANADGIQFTDGESLQKKLDDGTLGSGNVGASYIELSQEEYDALSDEEKVNGSEYRTYDTGHIYKLGVEFGKETDISGKQDNLSQVKFTMRRNSASEGRYCLIGSSDLSQNLLMCEPYRFQGIFGDGTTSVENKSIIDFMVSFREGVENPDDVLSGFANSSKGFDFVDLLITADETTNMAYAYVDFKVSGAVATGEITKPVLEAESYMDFAESFELVDTYQGTLVCKMSDYCKVITEIKDEVSDSTVWSSQKTSDKIDALISDTNLTSTTSTLSASKIMSTVRDSAVGLGMTKNGIHTIQEFFTFLIDKYGKKGCMDVQWSDANGAYVKHENTIIGINGGMLIWDGTDVTPDSTGAYQTMTALYIPHRRNLYSESDNYNGVYKIYCVVAATAGVVSHQGIEIIGNIDDSSTGNTTSTWSSSKIASEITSTYLIKDIVAGGDNEKTVSFKIRKEYFSAYYAKRTFLLSANIYSLGFSKPVIGLVEIFCGSADNYGGYVVNLQDTRFTGVTVTVNGDYLEVVVAFNSYESSGCMVSCSSLSNAPIA